MGKIKENISANITKHRKINGLSQKDLADIVGTKPSTVSSWEQSVSTPNAEMLFEICKIFKITVDEIYGVDEDETEYKFMKSIQYLEDAGFEVDQDDKDREYNEYQICHFDFGTITVMHQQDLIDLVDKIIKDGEDYKERYIIDRIKTEFLPKK
ncbi:helix-turn-helix domain-containing protein [Tepidibacter hydrothermalis]|uniref:Helix-turn-helix transcriptional regulator n=1 Tax=Tepidibacter hydrothermalis TaxID=3036126 RepID=A0ABY8EDK0_9FIRM|nr:helix-turn-helix transcriptional regulator [Tepidibacter hydrothermalis]WFD09970.1 helix-turn-helix transcriptional regulator [Tepidibacter hydrothermalis]